MDDLHLNQEAQDLMTRLESAAFGVASHPKAEAWLPQLDVTLKTVQEEHRTWRRAVARGRAVGRRRDYDDQQQSEAVVRLVHAVREVPEADASDLTRALVAEIAADGIMAYLGEAPGMAGLVARLRTERRWAEHADALERTHRTAQRSRRERDELYPVEAQAQTALRSRVDDVERGLRWVATRLTIELDDEALVQSILG